MHRDPLLDALIGKLPEVGEAWPHADRESWLNLMNAAFDLVYGREGAPTVRYAGPIELPKLPLSGDDAADVVLKGKWHVDAGGAARAPDGEEVTLGGVPRGTVFTDLRPGSDGRFDTIIWADGTWPKAAAVARELVLDIPARKAA